MTTQDDRYIRTIEEIAESLVRNDVYCNISHHIQRLLEGPGAAMWNEELADALSVDDWEGSAREAMDCTRGVELGDLVAEWGLLEAPPVPFSRSEVERALLAYGREDADRWREIAEALDPSAEPPTHEALEFWLVSDHLAERLEAQGEPVGELDGIALWGRTCRGQGITADGPILEIARKIAEV